MMAHVISRALDLLLAPLALLPLADFRGKKLLLRQAVVAAFQNDSV